MSGTKALNIPLWRNVSFMLMWSSVAASGFGDRMIQLAAEPMLGVYEPGASAASIQAGIAFFFFLPYLFLTVAGGWLADRIPRKWLMLACDEGRAAVLMLAFVMAAQLTTAQAIAPEFHWRVYLIMAATGCFAAIFNPTRQAVIPQIVPIRDLQPANAVLAAITIIASLVGFKVGGYLVEEVSIQRGVLVGALCYAISGLFFAFLKPVNPIHKGPPPRHHLVAQMVQAFGYFRRHAPVRNLIILNILFWCGSWIVVAAIAALTRNHYGLPVETYLTSKATMMALFGVGILGSSVTMLLIRTRRESGLLAMSMLVLAGVAMTGLAVFQVYWIGSVLAITIGFTGGVFLINVDSLTQSLTPNYIRGRVFGVRSMLNTFATVVINFVIWRLPESSADRLMIPALGVMGCVLVLVGMWSLVAIASKGPLSTAWLNAMWHVIRLYCFVWHRLKMSGGQNIPETGPVLLAANHTTGIDPLIMQAPSRRLVRWVMLRKYQYRVMNFVWRRIQPIAIDQNGKDSAQIRKIIAALREDAVVGIFPEGGLQRGHRDLQPFQPGIGLIARKSGAAIVPVWIEDTPRTQSMLWHFLLPSRSRVTFGEAYHPEPHMKNDEIMDDLRQRMLRLSSQADQTG